MTFPSQPYNCSAVADRNHGDRSGIFDEDNAPIANSKPAPVAMALEPLHSPDPFITQVVNPASMRRRMAAERLRH
jgi:hypothetical protein